MILPPIIARRARVVNRRCTGGKHNGGAEGRRVVTFFVLAHPYKIDPYRKFFSKSILVFRSVDRIIPWLCRKNIYDCLQDRDLLALGFVI